MVSILKVLNYLNAANKRLTWDKTKLKSYQDKQLKLVVKYAYQNVPFYHKRYKEAGVDVNSFRGIDDLDKLPIIKKEEFKHQPAKEITSSEFELSTLKNVRTSGSTGTPFIVYLTPKEDAWRKAIYMRANINCGQKPFDRWVVLTSPTHFGDTTSAQRKLGIFAQTCISLFESTDNKLKQIAEAKPNILDGYSSAVVMLAREIQKRGIKNINPRLVFGNAEYIDPQARKLVEKAFNAPYCDQFGCAEIDRSAWECLKREGYHMDVDSVVTEFLDKTGQQVDSGERGEVAYTSLFNFAMPFIRYAIGDIAVPSSDTCSCGNCLPLMKVVEGRKDSFLTLPNNRVLSPMIFNFAVSQFKHYTDIDQFRIRQKKIDKFEVALKLNKQNVNQTAIAQELEKHLTQYLQLADKEVDFDISFVSEIPLSQNGKLLSVWSDLQAPILE